MSDETRDAPPPGGDPEAEKARAAADARARAAEAAAKAKAAQAAAEAAKPAWERDPVVPQWVDAADDPLALALRERHGGVIESARRFAGELTLRVGRDSIAEVAASLKRDHGFDYLVDVCGADYPKREPRFEVVYHLYSHGANRRLRLKVTTDEATPVPSLCAVFRAANWPEREVYDMYGVRFSGHPDLSRILLWDGFNGHPLRKDFPVEGVDTGVAIYPEYYQEGAGPISKAGTGWLVKDAAAAGEEAKADE